MAAISKRRLSLSGRAKEEVDEESDNKQAAHQSERIALIEDLTHASDVKLEFMCQQLALVSKLAEASFELTPWNSDEPPWAFWDDYSTLTESNLFKELVASGEVVRVHDTYRAKVIIELFRSSSVRATVQQVQEEIRKLNIGLSAMPVAPGMKIIKKLPKLAYHVLCDFFFQQYDPKDYIYSQLPRSTQSPDWAHSYSGISDPIVAMKGTLQSISERSPQKYMLVQVRSTFAEKDWPPDTQWNLKECFDTLRQRVADEIRGYPYHIEFELTDTVITPLVYSGQQRQGGANPQGGQGGGGGGAGGGPTVAPAAAGDDDMGGGGGDAGAASTDAHGSAYGKGKGKGKSSKGKGKKGKGKSDKSKGSKSKSKTWSTKGKGAW